MPANHGPKLWPLLLSIVSAAMVLHCSTAVAQVNPAPKVFQSMPAGWSLEKSVVVPAAQRDVIARRLGVELQQLTNTVVAKAATSVQINTLECSTEQGAIQLRTKLLSGGRDKRFVHRNGSTIYEFVTRSASQMTVAAAARYELGIQPKVVKYRISFDAAGMNDGDSMQWNQLYNLFLQLDQKQSAKVEKEILQRSKSFKFGSMLRLRSAGLGEHLTEWTFSDNPSGTSSTCGGAVSEFNFTNLPTKAEIPFTRVTGIVTSETGAMLPATRSNSSKLTSSTSHWPVTETAITKLADEITASAKTERQKVAALLEWLRPGRNIKFGGDIVGSRYGTDQVLQQKFGHCWDFSDVFITLCRASDIPCRQVYGWLYERDGHIWAEVLIEGQGWKQVDPTAASGCGSDYVPIATSETGDIPLLYLSTVKVERI